MSRAFEGDDRIVCPTIVDPQHRERWGLPALPASAEPEPAKRGGKAPLPAAPLPRIRGAKRPLQ